MQTILRTALVLCLSFIAGCIAVLPIGEFVPIATDGKIHTSNCLGTKRVSYNFDGVPVSVWLSGSGSEDPPSRLNVVLTLAEGRIAQIPAPLLRTKPMSEGPEKIHSLPTWERSVVRFMKPNSKRLERVTVETAPAAGPLIGGKPNDGDGVLGHNPAKTFNISIPLGGLPAPGYLVQLPAIEIDGKLHTVAPIEYRHQYRVEFMVPVNC
jgi:hypothetical protein